jgi:hypothetical protein
MQLFLIALIGVGAAAVASLFTPLAIRAGRALQWKTQPSEMGDAEREAMLALLRTQYPSIPAQEQDERDRKRVARAN